MKTTKTIKEPATTREQHSYTCDRCGEPCDEREAKRYDVREATIEAKLGDAYPDGGSHEVIEVDCCYACFVAHALPALEAVGFRPRRVKVAW